MMLKLTSPDFSTFVVDSRHLRLIETRDPSDKKATHYSGGLSSTRLFVATGQIWVCQETKEQILDMLNPPDPIKMEPKSRRTLFAGPLDVKKDRM